MTTTPVIKKEGRSPLQEAVLRTLLYYDIWEYPLTLRELHCFLPVNGVDYDRFQALITRDGPGEDVRHVDGYYFPATRNPEIVNTRKERERNADQLWRIARVSMHIIKRFPFVRGVFVSGDLSKNATTRQSDIDFFLVTSPQRVWISRTLLIIFKKVFLLNRKKYFCLNNFTAQDHLGLDEQNIFLATEIAHLKPLFNSNLHHEYLQSNQWIRKFFPNFDTSALARPAVNERPSILQRLFEAPFFLFPSEWLDRFLMERMQGIWASRYPMVDKQTRHRIFRSTRGESRAYAGNYQDRVLQIYRKKLTEFRLEES